MSKYQKIIPKKRPFFNTKKIVFALQGMILFFYFSCSPKQKLNESSCIKKIPILHKTNIINDWSTNFLKKNQVVKIFYSNYIKDGGYIYYLSNNEIFYNNDISFASLINQVNIKKSLLNSQLFAFGDSLYIYNYKTKKINYLFDTLSTIDYSVNTISTILNYIPTLSSQQKLIKYKDKFCFLYNHQFNKLKGVNNLDTSIFLIVSDSNKFEKLGKYPKFLHREKTRFTETFFCVDSNSNIYYVHMGYDSIYKINTQNNILARGELHKYPKRTKYSSKLDGNLAQIRKYESENERNVFISLLHDQYIIVLKKLGNTNLLESKQYKFFVFDKNLEKLYCDTIMQEIIPMVQPTKKGFLFFNQNLKETYQYEIQ